MAGAWAGDLSCRRVGGISRVRPGHAVLLGLQVFERHNKGLKQPAGAARLRVAEATRPRPPLLSPSVM
jgi:hypothetical protein